jgi:hypothetical protein
MRRLRSLRWWGLFTLLPLAVAMMVLDDEAPFSQMWRLVLLGAIATVICVLAAAWAERNPDLIEREGADAFIGYRPLSGTIEAMGDADAEAVPREPFVAGHRRFISGYAPLDYPAVGPRGSDDAAEELPS